MAQINVPLSGLLGGESNNDNKYRYYYCIMNSSGSYTCEKREDQPENNKVSQLLSIRKEIPEILDPIIIKYKLTPKINVKK
jgi:hypothetical protein